MMGAPTHSSRQFRFAALGIILLTVVIRLPSLLHPQPIDSEAMYSVVANEIVDGGRPYIDAVERKPPLLFWTYAAVFRMAGKFNWKALHVVALVWTLCAMAGLYAIGNELFGSNTGLIAALFYTVFQPWWTWKNLSFDGEMLMNLPIIWAWTIAFRRSASPVRPELFPAGALLGAAFLLKQPAAIAAVPLGIYLLLPSYRVSRNLTPTNSIIQATMLTLGFFVALGSVVIILWKQGILHDAFYWTIADHDVPHVFWQKGMVNTLTFVAACLPLVIGAILACRDKDEIWAGKTGERTALLGLLAVSAIGAAAGARFYPHYYVQLIPPLAQLSTGRGWCHDVYRLKRDDIYSPIPLLTIKFSSGAKIRKYIYTLAGVLPAATSPPSRSRVMFSADRSRVSILAAGSCPAPGPFWSKILPRIRRPTLSMFTPTRKVRRIR